MIIIAKNILPGQSSEDFPAIQEKNVALLMETLKKKEATEALTAMGKTDRETWNNIKETVVGLAAFVSAGGISLIKQEFTEIVTFQLDYFLSPLINTFDQIIADALAPIMVKLNDIINELASWLTDNSEGSLIGGITGAFVGLWLPGGAIWTILGAVIGAALQDFFQSIMGSVGTIEPSENPMDPAAMAAYYAETGLFPSGPMDVAYLQWWASTYHPEWIFT